MTRHSLPSNHAFTFASCALFDWPIASLYRRFVDKSVHSLIVLIFRSTVGDDYTLLTGKKISERFSRLLIQLLTRKRGGGNMGVHNLPAAFMQDHYSVVPYLMRVIAFAAK